MSARVANRDNTVIEIKILKAEGGVEKWTGIPGFKRRKPAKDKQSMATLVLPTEFYEEGGRGCESWRTNRIPAMLPHAASCLAEACAWQKPALLRARVAETSNDRQYPSHCQQ